MSSIPRPRTLPDPYGNNAFSFAFRGDLDGLQRIGQVLMILDSGGFSPLHYAAMKGNTAAVDVLVNQCGVPLNILTAFEERTPLHLAIIHRHTDTAMALIEMGAEISRADNWSGFTAAHYAAFMGDIVILEALTSRDVNLLCRDVQGNTSLSIAAMQGHRRVCIFLAGVCPSALSKCNNQRLNPSVVAKRRGYPVTANVLNDPIGATMVTFPAGLVIFVILHIFYVFGILPHHRNYLFDNSPLRSPITWQVTATICTLYFFFRLSKSNVGYVMGDVGGPVKKKAHFCTECRLYQPVCAAHCVKCSRCVVGFSHHSRLFGVCVGEMNRHIYLVCLAILVLSLLISAICLILIFFKSGEPKFTGHVDSFIRARIGEEPLLICLLLTITSGLLWMSIMLVDYSLSHLSRESFKEISNKNSKNSASSPIPSSVYFQLPLSQDSLIIEQPKGNVIIGLSLDNQPVH